MIEFKQTKAGDIKIVIPRSYLRHSFEMLMEDGARVTNTKAFSDAVLVELEAEEEDGTTLVHVALDQAIERAVENGCDAVKIPGEY